MFLRRHRKTVGGETYEYWTLVKTVRTAKGPRHQTVAHLGKLDADVAARSGDWRDVDAMLEGRVPDTQLELGQEPPPKPPPLWRSVDLSR